MKTLKRILCTLLTAILLLTGAAALAEGTATQPVVYQTADGVLSIQAPNRNWTQLADPNYWFAMTDGEDIITISHLSNGEALPAVSVADQEFAAVYHAFVSTRNEVFVIKGCAMNQDHLQDIMAAIATIRVLKFDTRLAVRQIPVRQQDVFSVVPVNQIMYSTSKHLNVRSEWTTDSRKLGHLIFGQIAQVTGIVTRNGVDFGWRQINYNRSVGYVSAAYLTDKVPDAASWIYEDSHEEEDTGNPPFTVYAEDGSSAEIWRRDDGKTYQDAYNHTYYYTASDLYYCEDRDKSYAADPLYWVRQQQEESGDQSYSDFEVFAQDGSSVRIYPAAATTFKDYMGYTYTNTRGDLYYCQETEVLYSADRAYWINGEPVADEQQVTAEDPVTHEEEDTGNPPFTVYAEDGSSAEIWQRDDGKTYQDAYNHTYYYTASDLYYCEDREKSYAADPLYWVRQQQEESYNQNDSDIEVFAQDGSSVRIYPATATTFKDYMGYTYTNTRGDLYYCEETEILYSADRAYWINGEPVADDVQETQEAIDEGTTGGGTIDSGEGYSGEGTIDSGEGYSGEGTYDAGEGDGEEGGL